MGRGDDHWGGMLDSRPFMEALTWQHWMLIGSHLGMALQAVLYAPFYIYRSGIILIARWLDFARMMRPPDYGTRYPSVARTPVGAS